MTATSHKRLSSTSKSRRSQLAAVMFTDHVALLTISTRVVVFSLKSSTKIALSSFAAFVENLGFSPPQLAQDIGQLPRDLLQGGEDLAIEG
jgi:hypothetical protein